MSFKTFLFKVGGGLPVVQKQASVQKKPSWQQGQVAHNPLDSTCPMVKKGKQREVPKAKKPTPLKKVSPLTSKQIQAGDIYHKCISADQLFIIIMFLCDPQVILKEREERKHKRLLEERGLVSEDELKPVNDAEEEQCDINITGQSKNNQNQVLWFSQLQVD